MRYVTICSSQHRQDSVASLLHHLNVVCSGDQGLINDLLTWPVSSSVPTWPNDLSLSSSVSSWPPGLASFIFRTVRPYTRPMVCTFWSSVRPYQTSLPVYFSHTDLFLQHYYHYWTIVNLDCSSFFQPLWFYFRYTTNESRVSRAIELRQGSSSPSIAS